MSSDEDDSSDQGNQINSRVNKRQIKQDKKDDKTLQEPKNLDVDLLTKLNDFLDKNPNTDIFKIIDVKAELKPYFNWLADRWHTDSKLNNTISKNTLEMFSNDKVIDDIAKKFDKEKTEVNFFNHQLEGCCNIIYRMSRIMIKLKTYLA